MQPLISQSQTPLPFGNDQNLQYFCRHMTCCFSGSFLSCHFECREDPADELDQVHAFPWFLQHEATSKEYNFLFLPPERVVIKDLLIVCRFWWACCRIQPARDQHKQQRCCDGGRINCCRGNYCQTRNFRYIYIVSGLSKVAGCRWKSPPTSWSQPATLLSCCNEP